MTARRTRWHMVKEQKTRICWGLGAAFLHNLSNIKGITCGLLLLCPAAMEWCWLGFFFSFLTGLCSELQEPTVAERTFEPLQKHNVLNC